jgi:hypothetical protein
LSTFAKIITMKSIVALFAAIVLVTACQNQAQDKQATTSAATSDVTTVQWLDSARDMGQITEGQKLEVSFRFKNTGSKPLVIKNVHASCGCTVPEVPKEPIAPGEEGIIKGLFDSQGKVGKNNKTLTVEANLADNQPHVLSFSVEVLKKN